MAQTKIRRWRHVTGRRKAFLFTPDCRARTVTWRATGVLDRIERHPVTRAFVGAVAMFSAVVLFLTYTQLRQDLEDRKEERQARQEERVDRALVRLRDRAGGDTNKGWALNVLLEAGIDTQGIDVSCTAIGIVDKDGACTSRPIFRGVQPGGPLIRFGRSGVIPFSFVSSEGAEFIDGNFDGAFVGNAFDGAVIRRSSLIGSTWVYPSAENNPVRVASSDLSFSEIQSRSFGEVILSNISGVTLLEANEAMTAESVLLNWAWADYPPVIGYGDLNSAKVIQSLRLCDPAYRIADTRVVTVRQITGWPKIEVPFAVTGINPQIDRDLYPGAKNCPAIPFSEAVRRFPAAYQRND